MYNLSTSTETQIITNNSIQRVPDIYEDRIVWEDYRNGNWDIYMYNLSTSTETQITTNEFNQGLPSIYGDRIVWVDDRSGRPDIYMGDFSTFEIVIPDEYKDKVKEGEEISYITALSKVKLDIRT